MVEVVITTPEMLVTEDFTELMAVKWEILVVDEAHRLKNHNSKLAQNLRDKRFEFNQSLLLTGVSRIFFLYDAFVHFQIRLIYIATNTADTYSKQHARNVDVAQLHQP